MCKLSAFIFRQAVLAIVPGLLAMLFAQEKLSEHLQALEPFVGKTWKGGVGKGKDGNPIYDISRWERALNGKAVRILHSVNDGAYGGETLVLWDSEKESLVYYYFTTAGFYTHGTITVDGDKMISHEYVSGEGAHGVTEVKSVSRIMEDGDMKVDTEMLKAGEWQDRSTVIYRSDPDAAVVFK